MPLEDDPFLTSPNTSFPSFQERNGDIYVTENQSCTLVQTWDNLTFPIHRRRGLGRTHLIVTTASPLHILAGEVTLLQLAVDGRTCPKFTGDIWDNPFWTRVRAENRYMGSLPRCCSNLNKS